MQNKKAVLFIKNILFLAMLFAAKVSVAQNPVNWTPNQLMQPAQLAQLMQQKKPLPIILSVGPGALIPQSTDIGPTQEKENLDKLKKQLSGLPKDAAIVVYCGCCPFEHCPNVRPAIQALKDMHFTNYKLLNLEHNIRKDWIDKGYPKVQQ